MKPPVSLRADWGFFIGIALDMSPIDGILRWKRVRFWNLAVANKLKEFKHELGCSRFCWGGGAEEYRKFGIKYPNLKFDFTCIDLSVGGTLPEMVSCVGSKEFGDKCITGTYELRVSNSVFNSYRTLKGISSLPSYVGEWRELFQEVVDEIMSTATEFWG